MSTASARAAHARSRGTVLLLVNNLGAGGSERQLSQMAAYWAARGVGVTVATWTDGSTPDFFTLPAAIHRVHLGVKPGLRGLLSSVWALSKLIRRTSPDMIVSFGDAVNAVTWMSSLSAGRQCCLAIRANPEETLRALHWAWAPLALAAYRFSHRVVVQTQAVARWAGKAVHRNVDVIPNALRPMREPCAARETLIVTVGSLLAYKGHDVLLKAFARVHTHNRDWRLAIVGEGPRRATLSALCTELGIEGKVDMPGQSRDVESWLERASIFVLPSRQEGFPNALIEAMAMGVAVISTDCRHGPPEIIVHGTNGLLTPVDDVEAMADSLRRLMDDPKLRSTLGEAAQSVRQVYDEDVVMRAWETVLSGGPSAGRDHPSH